MEGDEVINLDIDLAVQCQDLMHMVRKHGFSFTEERNFLDAAHRFSDADSEPGRCQYCGNLGKGVNSRPAFPKQGRWECGYVLFREDVSEYLANSTLSKISISATNSRPQRWALDQERAIPDPSIARRLMLRVSRIESRLKWLGVGEYLGTLTLISWCPKRLCSRRTSCLHWMDISRKALRHSRGRCCS